MANLPSKPWAKHSSRTRNEYAGVMFANNYFVYYIAGDDAFKGVLSYNILDGQFNREYQIDIIPWGIDGYNEYFYYCYEESGRFSIPKIEQFITGVPKTGYNLVPTPGILLAATEAGIISREESGLHFYPNSPGPSNKFDGFALGLPTFASAFGSSANTSSTREIWQLENIGTVGSTSVKLLGQTDDSTCPGTNGVCFFNRIAANEDYIYFESVANNSSRQHRLVRYARVDKSFTSVEEVAQTDRLINYRITSDGVLYTEEPIANRIVVKYVTHSSKSPKVIYEGDVYDIALSTSNTCLYILTGTQLLRYGL